MRNAARIDLDRLTPDEFHAWIDRSLYELSVTFPDGVLVRLHSLGDFVPYHRDVDNDDYVRFWITMLERYPNVRVWGFTHVPYESGAGVALRAMNDLRDERGRARAAILFSNKAHDTHATAQTVREYPESGIVTVAGRELPVCRAQMEDTKCTHCTHCFPAEKPDEHGPRGVAFVDHATLHRHKRELPD